MHRQLTVQELSVMIREGVKPIIFVLNNQGYTIERLIHGKHRWALNRHRHCVSWLILFISRYNDIANWAWTSLLTSLNTNESITTLSYRVSTKEEMMDLLKDEGFNQTKVMQLVEIVMEPLDAPRALEVQAELSGKANVFAPAVIENLGGVSNSWVNNCRQTNMYEACPFLSYSLCRANWSIKICWHLSLR